MTCQSGRPQRASAIRASKRIRELFTSGRRKRTRPSISPPQEQDLDASPPQTKKARVTSQIYLTAVQCQANVIGPLCNAKILMQPRCENRCWYDFCDVHARPSSTYCRYFMSAATTRRCTARTKKGTRCKAKYKVQQPTCRTHSLRPVLPPWNCASVDVLEQIDSLKAQPLTTL